MRISVNVSVSFDEVLDPAVKTSNPRKLKKSRPVFRQRTWTASLRFSLAYVALPALLVLFGPSPAY